MRGTIDLTRHDLAGVFVPQAPRTSWRRAKIRNAKGDAHRQIWRLVDGAVRDAFSSHPDYLTTRGSRLAQEAITKRVVGALHGYAAQVAKGRSETTMNFVSAAIVETPTVRMGARGTGSLLRLVQRWAQLLAHPKFARRA